MRGSRRHRARILPAGSRRRHPSLLRSGIGPRRLSSGLGPGRLSSGVGPGRLSSGVWPRVANSGAWSGAANAGTRPGAATCSGAWPRRGLRLHGDVGRRWARGCCAGGWREDLQDLGGLRCDGWLGCPCATPRRTSWRPSCGRRRGLLMGADPLLRDLPVQLWDVACGQQGEIRAGDDRTPFPTGSALFLLSEALHPTGLSLLLREVHRLHQASVMLHHCIASVVFHVGRGYVLVVCAGIPPPVRTGPGALAALKSPSSRHLCLDAFAHGRRPCLCKLLPHVAGQLRLACGCVPCKGCAAHAVGLRRGLICFCPGAPWRR